MSTPSQVSIGPASILGWIAAAAGIVTSTVQSLETGGALVSGPGKWPAILGVVALAATNAGRQFQAAHLTKAAAVAETAASAVSDASAVLPTLQEELAAQPPPIPPPAFVAPESAAVPDAAQPAAPPAVAPAA